MSKIQDPSRFTVWRSPLPGSERAPSCCVLTLPNGPGSALKPFYRNCCPSPEGSTLMTSSPSKGPTSSHHHFGVRFRHWGRAWETQTLSLWQVAPFKRPK